MIKEELKQEAEEFTDSKKSFWRQGRTCIDSVKQAYLAGAEPREKRIAELEVTNKKISNECHKLVDSLEKKQKEIAELEAQIEKMKCCENCGWYYLQQHWRESKEINESRMFHCGTCGNKRNWKLKEIKEK